MRNGVATQTRIAAGRPRFGRTMTTGAVMAIVTLGTLAGTATFAGPAGASGKLHLKPHALKFKVVKDPGGPCEGTGCDYAEVKVINDTATSQTLTGGSTASTTFWVTWGGTCNVEYAYVIPTHTSCTVQFGFEPPAAHTHYASTGTLDFAGGAQLSVGLKGHSS
jgi:hypothetical protein